MGRWGRSEVERINRKRPFRMPIKDELPYKLKTFCLKMKFQTQRILFKENRAHECLYGNTICRNYSSQRKNVTPEVSVPRQNVTPIHIVISDASILSRSFNPDDEAAENHDIPKVNGDSLPYERSRMKGRKSPLSDAFKSSVHLTKERVTNIIKSKNAKDIKVSSTMPSEEEFHLNCEILTFERQVFQRYHHYTTIVGCLAEALEMKYKIEKEHLLPTFCTEDPKVAVLYSNKESFDDYSTYISKDKPYDHRQSTIQNAVKVVDCLVLFLSDGKSSRKIKDKMNDYYTQRRQRDGFLTAIFVTGKGLTNLTVDGNFDSETLCLIDVGRENDGSVTKLKSLIQSAFERRLLLALEDFKIDSREMNHDFQQRLSLEINVHKSALRAGHNALFETTRRSKTKDYSGVIDKFLERYGKGIHMYGIFFEELIFYFDKERKKDEDMEFQRQNLERLCERNVKFLYTDSFDPKPLYFCGKPLYNGNEVDASVGTLGGLACTIQLDSNNKREIGMSCCHVTSRAESWYVRTREGDIKKLGMVKERSDCWSKEKEDIYYDISLIELDGGFLKELKEEDMYYFSFTRKHKIAQIFGIEDPRKSSMEIEDRHIYRRKRGSDSEFIHGLILGYMWWRRGDVRLRSIVVAGSSLMICDGVDIPFAEEGDSGSLVFSSDFNHKTDGDEILCVRAMVTHGIKKGDRNIAMKLTKGIPPEESTTRSKSENADSLPDGQSEDSTTQGSNSLQASSVEQHVEQSTERNAIGPSSSQQAKRQFCQVVPQPEGEQISTPNITGACADAESYELDLADPYETVDIRLLTFCMEMNEANEKLKKETKKRLCFDMEGFGKFTENK